MLAHDALKKYFLTGTAEEDRHFLDRVFVTPSQLAEVVSIPPGSLRVIAGSKGIGKTAIFEWLHKIATVRKLPVLLLRPDDIAAVGIGPDTDIASLKRAYFEALVSAVLTAMGRSMRGLLTGSAAEIYDAAVKAGVRNPDFIGRALQLLTAISIPVAQIDGVKLAKDLAGKLRPDDLIRAIQSHLLSSGSVFFLLIDDTDQVASPAEPDHPNRIWALLLAARKLTGDCPSVRCAVSLRSEVWARMERDSHGQRDQTDHLRNLVIPLRASDEQIEKVVRKRLELAAAEVNAQPTVDPYSVFFQQGTVQLPYSEERRPWETFIAKSARERPRDAIQLVRSLADQAAKGMHQKIGDADATEAMKRYSSERFRDACEEYSRDCPGLDNVIRSFTAVSFESSFEEIRKHLVTVPSRASVNVRGRALQAGNDEDAIHLLQFLHETGFINPRIPDVRQPKNFRHVNFHDDPYFVSSQNWNEMQGATWEVHPAFRSLLIMQSRDRISRDLATAKIQMSRK